MAPSRSYDPSPTLMGDLAADFVRMPETEAGQIGLSHYGIQGTAERLSTEKDDTFRLTASDDRHYILKIANPAEPEEEIAAQVALLEHLAFNAPTLPVPRVIPNHDGQSLPVVIDAAGQTRRMRLMSYLAGRPLDSTDTNGTEREKVGELEAALRLAMADFTHPGCNRTVLWDVRNLALLQPLLNEIANDSQRLALSGAMTRFLEMQPEINRLRMQVVHNDFSRSNIIVDRNAEKFVTGVIDFGDAVYTAIVIDVSTALLNQLPSRIDDPVRDNIFRYGYDLLRGYLRIADLTQAEMWLLPHLVMGRIVARTLITLWRARLFPDNETYILRNTHQGWAQLDWFLMRSPDEVSRSFISGFHQ
ncbi:phosphotransferase [Komagataeibacter diospyri]|uniref:Aminoglycoside phosphotransferase n=1 Tax=Komagataeibacter diospyri TaxID=1932662 RepID=A0A4P5P1I7_9PROT|nr:phosphotransferase [Komagataeibacter diospyri]GCE82045.1 aminoglycoside phosphotransferase [Komagataeibacter diospyri]GCE88879.1 aminoglycoside phosphotransferase [Komagataeibacter diospyri]